MKRFLAGLLLGFLGGAAVSLWLLRPYLPWGIKRSLSTVSDESKPFHGGVLSQ